MLAPEGRLDWEDRAAEEKDPLAFLYRTGGTVNDLEVRTGPRPVGVEERRLVYVPRVYLAFGL